MDALFDKAIQEKEGQMELGLPLEPYKDQSEIISDWFRFFDTMRGGRDAREEVEGVQEQGKWVIAHQGWEAKLWQRWELTEKLHLKIPFMRFAHSNSLSRDEIKILFFIFHRMVIRDCSIHNPFTVLRELYGDYKLVFEKLPVFARDRTLVKSRLIIQRSVYHDEDYILSEIITRLLCGFDKKVSRIKEEPSNGRSDLLWVVKPKKTLSQVVLTPGARQAIDEALLQIRNKKVFENEWGFKEVLEKGQAVAMLFHGPPGTGKTVTAEGIAGTLKRKLAVVNLAGMLNLWLGETEKNIVEIFQHTQKSQAVLLLDEADAFLASRVSDDLLYSRHYNRKVSILLKMLEEYKGIAILTTNMVTILDPALARRINPKVEFGLPDYEARVRLWHCLIPKRLPLDKNVSIEFLAKNYELTGGQIKNAVVGAARAALAQGKRVVTMVHLIRAVEQETGYQPKRAIGFA